MTNKHTQTLSVFTRQARSIVDRIIALHHASCGAWPRKHFYEKYKNNQTIIQFNAMSNEGASITTQGSKKPTYTHK